jgi:hypothetical protein
MNYEIVTRAEALRQGLVRYFTGKPCKRGHISERFTNNGSCLNCQSDAAARNYETNRAMILARCGQYYRKNKTTFIDRATIWRIQNPEKIKVSVRKYKSKNKGKINAATVARRLAKLNRTPKWAELDKIKQLYINCPQGYHVDHIIPLRGEFVSGLHVYANLQYLPALENMSKGNKFDPTQLKS